MEQSTEENEAIVSRIYTQMLSLDGDLSKMSPAQRLVYLVEHLMQEVNSGASFEQYFRWASVEEIELVGPALRDLDLNDVSAIFDSAVSVAFPNGIPTTPEEKDDLTDWSEEQETELEALFNQAEQLNGRVMNVLGQYAIRTGA